MISVALIEDNRLVCEALVALLCKVRGVKLVAAESSAGLESLEGLQPDVILLDVGLWDDASLHTAETIMEQHPATKVIVMDLLPVQANIVRFVNSGVSGFILKDASFEDLIETIRAVAAGANVLPPEMTSTLFSQIATEALGRGRAAAARSEVRMTTREREVIELIGEGLANKEIAARLNIATHTAKSHVRNVMDKLALHTRLQIAAFAHRD